MARRRDFKAEYARRIARATAQGKTRQQARGHKAHEHVERRERERREFGLSGSEVRSISAWYKRFNPHGYKEIPSLDDVIDFARTKGYERFKLYRETWEIARRTYLREIRNGSYATRGEGYLNILADMAEVMPPGEPAWLYYH